MKLQHDVMLRTWQEQKAQVPGMLLLIRLGDFYEAFGDDAETLSRKMEITLTSRKETKLAGVPYHMIGRTVETLTKAGVAVAVSEPVDPMMGLQGKWHITQRQEAA